MNRVLLAGLIGGVVLFAWLSVAHVLLPLGEAGISEIPNEGPVLESMKASISKDGFYFFPGFGLPEGATSEQQKAAMPAWEEKYKNGPHGILIYHPTGTTPMTARQLVTEFLTNVVQALLAMILLSCAKIASLGRRFAFVVILGLLASISTNISYWNWYGFPFSYTMSTVFTMAMGFALMGLVGAWMVRPSSVAA
jgi:hypothetical protein